MLLAPSRPTLGKNVLLLTAAEHSCWTAGKPPFGGNNHVQLLHNINSSEACLPDAVAGRISGSCRCLLQQLLRRVPEQRLTFEVGSPHVQPKPRPAVDCTPMERCRF